MRRYERGSALERFKAQRAALQVNRTTAQHSVYYCVRLVSEGQSCALILGSSEDSNMVVDLVTQTLSRNNIQVLSGGGGGFLLANGAQIRLFNINNAHQAHILLGPDVKMVYVKEGDPIAQKAKEFFDL